MGIIVIIRVDQCNKYCGRFLAKLCNLFRSEWTTTFASCPPYYDSKFCAIVYSKMVAFPSACHYRKLMIKFLFLLHVLQFLAGFKKNSGRFGQML